MIKHNYIDVGWSERFHQCIRFVLFLSQHENSRTSTRPLHAVKVRQRRRPWWHTRKVISNHNKCSLRLRRIISILVCCFIRTRTRSGGKWSGVRENVKICKVSSVEVSFFQVLRHCCRGMRWKWKTNVQLTSLSSSSPSVSYQKPLRAPIASKCRISSSSPSSCHWINNS